MTVPRSHWSSSGGLNYGISCSKKEVCLQIAFRIKTPSYENLAIQMKRLAPHGNSFAISGEVSLSVERFYSQISVKLLHESLLSSNKIRCWICRYVLVKRLHWGKKKMMHTLFKAKEFLLIIGCAMPCLWGGGCGWESVQIGPPTPKFAMYMHLQSMSFLRHLLLTTNWATLITVVMWSCERGQSVSLLLMFCTCRYFILTISRKAFIGLQFQALNVQKNILLKTKMFGF